MMASRPTLSDLLAEVFAPPIVVTFIDPWLVRAYGQYFMGATPEEAMEAADQYGELHQLSAVSLVAHQLSEYNFHAV